MKNQSENLIVKLSFQFSLNVVEYAEILDEKKKWVIAKQVLKSGTSIGANVREAQGAESRNDFIHKLKFPIKKPKKPNIGWISAISRRIILILVN